MFLPKGTRLMFQVHYTPDGTARPNAIEVGMIRAERPPDYVVRYKMAYLMEPFTIPAGARGVRIEDAFELDEDVLLRSLLPHVHLRGRRFDVTATLPGGARRSLLEIPDWDPDWQLSYLFGRMPWLPRGTRIELVGTFDNSADNPNNPDPTVDVHNGQQTTDEMLVLVAEWLVPRVKR